MFKMPEGLHFYKLEKGTKRLSFLPYKAGKGNPYVNEGEEHYERTFYTYNKIGADEKRYIAPGKTCNQKDYVQEYVQKEARNPKADQDALKALMPKERQIFLVYDHDDPGKGVQLFELSYHKFGKLLDRRIQNSAPEKEWDMFYFPDPDGFILELTVIDTGTYGLEVSAIDFERRTKPLPEEVFNHGICLDNILHVLSYDELKARFLCLTDDEATSSEGSEPRVERRQEREEPRREERKEETQKPEPEQTKPKSVTAAERGIDRDDSVIYDGRAMTVVRVSGDGTSLTLMEDATDEIHKAISPAEVKKVSPQVNTDRRVEQQDTKKEEPKRLPSEPPFEESKKDESSGDADWDKDW